MDEPQNTRRVGIRLRRDAVLENSPIQIGTLLAEIELADGTSLEDIERLADDVHGERST